MLIWFVVLYLLVSIGIGLYAATRVHNTRDYAVARRSLPLYVVTATGARRVQQRLSVRHFGNPSRITP
jgi:Na+/proline symporter